MEDYREEIRKYNEKAKKRREKERREDEKFWQEVGQSLRTLFILGKRYVNYFFISLTRYFPFSLFSRLTWMTYENREAYHAHCSLNDTGYMTGIFFECEQFYKDENFIFFEGKFDKVAKNASEKTFLDYLSKIYGEGNIFLTDMENGMKRIKINREAALERNYGSFLSKKQFNKKLFQ